MTFKTDFEEDIKEIKYDNDEISDDATWTSNNGLSTGEFKVILGDRNLHGDEEKGGVFEEDVQASALSSDLIVQQIRIEDFLVIKNVEYEVVNNPFLDSPNGFEVNIVLRRKHQTRI